MLVRIHDIENENLRLLIKKRSIEYYGETCWKVLDSSNSPIIECFRFHLTPEGVDFWMDVYHGIITEI